MNKKDKNFKQKESKRVQAYRARKAREGYRNISFTVSPDEYEDIEKAREELGLTTKELLLYYIRGQYMRVGGDSWSPFFDDFEKFENKMGFNTPEGVLNQLRIEQKQGECFQLKSGRREKSYQTYVIAEFLYVNPGKKDYENYFPFKWSCPNKGYETYEEAMIAYLQKKPKLRKNRQHMLLRKKLFEEHEVRPPVENWYYPVLLLNLNGEIYPGQIGAFSWVIDPVNYKEEYERIKQELGI